MRLISPKAASLVLCLRSTVKANRASTVSRSEHGGEARMLAVSQQSTSFCLTGGGAITGKVFCMIARWLRKRVLVLYELGGSLRLASATKLGRLRG